MMVNRNNDEVMVSVYCLAYNHERYIRKALEGFISQKVNFKFEVIVHDDASTDNTTAIIREYEERYPEIIKPIYESENQYGKGTIRKKMFSELRGRYTAFCECDDYWTDSNKLQLQVDYLNAHNECSFCFHDAIIIWENGKYKCDFFRSDDFKNKIVNESKRLSAGDVIDLGFIPTASLVARTEYVIFSKRYVDRPVCGDLPQRLYLASVGEGYYIDRKMCAYRTGNTNSVSGMSRKTSESAERTFYGHVEILNAFNKDTNYLWNKNIQHDIQKRRLRLLMGNLDMASIKKENLYMLYKNEINIKGKVRFVIKTRFIGVYELLRWVRNKVKGV